MTAAIRFAAVSREVQGRALLRDVTLSIEPGERVALIGPSGAGKTTLLRLIAGLVPRRHGELSVLGCDPTALQRRRFREFRRRVGLLLQSDNTVPQLRVVHNVLMARLGHWSLLRSLWSLLRPLEVAAAHAALQRVELGDRLWSLPDELSGGERQRVAIARLLLQEPEIVLADEPVSSLDVRLGREVVQRLFELVAPAGRTLLVSLHSLALLDAGFDRVIALRDGVVVADDAPAAFDRERLRSVYGEQLRQLDVDPS